MATTCLLVEGRGRVLYQYILIPGPLQIELKCFNAKDDNTVDGHDGNKKKGDHNDSQQGEIEDFPESRFRFEF